MPKYTVTLQRRVTKYYVSEVDIEASSEDEAEQFIYSSDCPPISWHNAGEDDMTGDVEITNMWEV